MDLRKIKSISTSEINHYDILGNIIGIGDIVAVAYRNKMYYGIVDKTNQKYLKILDKIQIDNGNNIQIGRGIVGENCLIINKEIDNSVKASIENKIEDNKNSIKKEKSTYKILCNYFNESEKGIIILLVEKNKNSIQNALNSFKSNFNNYNIKIYTKNKCFEYLEKLKISEIYFYSSSKYIFGWGEEYDLIDKYLKNSMIEYIDNKWYLSKDIIDIEEKEYFTDSFIYDNEIKRYYLNFESYYLSNFNDLNISEEI